MYCTVLDICTLYFYLDAFLAFLTQGDINGHFWHNFSCLKVEMDIGGQMEMSYAMVIVQTCHFPPPCYVELMQEIKSKLRNMTALQYVWHVVGFDIILLAFLF